MPADRLAFAVGVGGEQQLRCFLESALEMRNLLLLVAWNDVVRREVLIDVDAEAAPALLLDLFGHFGGRFREIADMAVARLDAVLVAKEPAQGLRLRRRLNDDQRFCHSM
jgi:hypothetical protein